MFRHIGGAGNSKAVAQVAQNDTPSFLLDFNAPWQPSLVARPFTLRVPNEIFHQVAWNRILRWAELELSCVAECPGTRKNSSLFAVSRHRGHRTDRADQYTSDPFALLVTTLVGLNLFGKGRQVLLPLLLGINLEFGALFSPARQLSGFL